MPASSIARALLVGVSVLGLAACDPASEEQAETAATQADTSHEVIVTAAFTGVDGGTESVIFVPNAAAPSFGLVVSATREGGLDVFNSDGELKVRHAGARLAGLAAAPNFQLRGSDLPLVFGAAPDSNQIFGYALVTGDDVQVLDLPLAQHEATGGVAGVCQFREGAGYVDLAVLGTGATSEIWRVRDSGEEQLSVETIAQIDLPAPARQCVGFEGELYTVSPGSGIARVDVNGALQAQRQATIENIAVADFNGTRLLLANDGIGDELTAYHAEDFSFFGTVSVVDGLSTPGLARPGAMAVTMETYGFTAYSEGLLAVYDIDDSRIKVISREAFARGLVTEG